MAPLPTTHLYFLNSCADSVSSLFRRRPIRRLGDNCFAAGETVLLVRQDRPNLMDRLRAYPPGRLVYLVDDDIQAAREDASLPRRLSQPFDAFSRGISRGSRCSGRHAGGHIGHAAAEIFLTSRCQDRASRLASGSGRRPSFRCAGHGGAMHAMHLGTASHQAGLDFLKPVVEVLLKRFARFHFSYVGRGPRLGALDAHPRVHRERPQSWSRYRRTLGKTPHSSGSLSIARHAIQSGEIAKQGTGARNRGRRRCLFALLAAPQANRRAAQFSREKMQRTGSRRCRPTWRSRSDCVTSRKWRGKLFCRAE